MSAQHIEDIALESDSGSSVDNEPNLNGSRTLDTEERSEELTEYLAHIINYQHPNGTRFSITEISQGLGWTHEINFYLKEEKAQCDQSNGAGLEDNINGANTTCLQDASEVYQDHADVLNRYQVVLHNAKDEGVLDEVLTSTAKESDVKEGFNVESNSQELFVEMVLLSDEERLESDGSDTIFVLTIADPRANELCE